MKKCIAGLLSLLLALSLCACGGVELPPLPTAEPKPSPEVSAEPAAPVETAPAAEEKLPEVIVSFRHELHEAYDPEKHETLILHFAYDIPTIVMEERPQEAAWINEFTGLLAETFYTGENYGEGPGTGYNNMLTMAEDNYLLMQNSSEENRIYEMSADQSVTVERNDGRVLTLRYLSSSYTGGAHGMSVQRCYSFDPATGRLLTLASISEDEAALREYLASRLVELSINDEGIASATSGFLMPDTRDEALSALLRDGSWYFDYDGMVIFSDLYEISSYAAGIISFRIPWYELEGRVDARYFPVKRQSSGSFRVLPEEQMQDGSVEIVDMLRTDESGTTVYLVSDGSVSDVRIDAVSYSGYFYPTAALWSCSEMHDAAVQLVTVIPDGMPKLRVRWRDSFGEHTGYLSQSGYDGSLILADEDIEAVG